MEKTTAAPKLDKPGAGLPFSQWLLTRFYYGPFVSARADWSASRAMFETAYQKILQAFDGLTEEEMRIRILVPPQVGLEDSSRYWSVTMALEHLVIVGSTIKAGILQLTNGHVPPIKVDIAKVKPLGEKSVAQTLKEFREFSSTVMPELEAGMKNRESKLTLVHPWFGPFKARQWYWLLGMHSLIHLRQIKAIRKGLQASSTRAS